MSKNTIVSGFLVLTIMLFNTGCISKFFTQDKSPNRTTQGSSQNSNILKKYKNPDVECNDDLTITKSACDRGTISENELKKRPTEGEVHSLTSIRGKKIHIKEMSNGFIFPEYRNKIILLEMFGKDCPHCLKELPTIKKIRRRYRGKLEVIAIQAQGKMDRFTAKNYINGHQIRYPIIEGDDAKNLQYFIQKTYGWRGILPYILVVKDGVTEFAYSGEVDYPDIEKDIDSIL